MLAVVKGSLTGLLAAAALAGCSSGGEAAPKPIAGTPKQVARVVAELESATRAGRYGAICDELFTRAARRRAGGRDCPRLIAEVGRGLRRPSIRLLSIRIAGGRAEARVRSRAAGQAPLVDTILLRREGGRYRIESLAG